MPRHAGHRSGLKAARGIIEACGERRVEALTLFAFSSENWRRPAAEVGRLMELFLNALNDEVGELHAKQVRLRFIGDPSHFAAELRERMQAAERLTVDNAGLRLQIAVGYGGRADIVQAARKLIRRARSGELQADALDEAMFARELSLAGMPEPDLFIRTGGEKRISNFLLWNLAYTELYFTDTLWPDFDATALQQAIDWFGERRRRFGRTPEQVENARA